MAKAWKKAGLTGGTADDLDGLSVGDLTTGDFAVTFEGGVRYWHEYDSTATAAEDSPNVIRPDDYSSGGNWELQDVQGVLGAPPSGVEIQGNVTGLELAINAADPANDIDIAAGICMDSTNSATISLATAITKRIEVAWVADTNNGGMLNGAVAANKIYHVYALLKDSDASVDAGFLLDGDDIDTYKPAGYSKYRWLGYVRTVAGPALAKFLQTGDKCLYAHAGDWLFDTGIGSGSWNTVTYTDWLPTSRVKEILYGVRDAATDGVIRATDDGTNTSAVIGYSNTSDISDTGSEAWGNSWYNSGVWLPFYEDRKFRSNTGTLTLMIHGVVFKR
jgi:hypothetical protein